MVTLHRVRSLAPRFQDAPVLMLVLAIAVSVSAPQRTSALPNPGEQQEILLLFTEDATPPWNQALTEGFADFVARRPHSPVLYFEYLDSARFNSPDDSEAFRDQLLQKYRGRDIDEIVAVGEPAIHYLAKQRTRLWPDASVYLLATGQPDPEIRRQLGPAGGLVIEDSLGETLRVLKALLPIKRIERIHGESAGEREYFREAPKAVRDAGLEFEDISGLTMPEVLQHVANRPAGTIIWIFGPHIDQRGRVTVVQRLCEEISSAANVPTLLFNVENMGCGILGGVERDFRLIGWQLADGALKQLDGAPRVVKLLPKESFTSTVFDARQLKRWGIPESKLPPGSTVMFRTPSLWTDYRPQVVMATGAILVQFALIAGLLYQRQLRRAAEAASRRDLAVATRAGRLTAMGTLTASIAHELSQPLGAILHNVEALKLTLKNNGGVPSDTGAILEDISKQDLRARDILTRIAALVQRRDVDKLPVDLNAIVDESVEFLAHEARARRVSIQKNLTSRPGVVIGDRIHFMQVTNNLLLNAMEAMTRTPEAQRTIVVTTATDHDGVALTIRDHGSGLSAELAGRVFDAFVTTKPDGIGIGLAIAERIVTTHGGRIDIANNPDGGATARVWLPATVA